MDGKEERRARTGGMMWQRAAANLDGRAETAAPNGLRVVASKTRREKGSTRRRCAARKSTPKIGFVTAAKMNVQRKVRKPKLRVRVTVPQEAMAFPLAPVSGNPEEGDDEEWGRTLTAAPVSTKNCIFDLASWRKIRPPTALS
jgi:hypothetical protein